MFSSKFAFVVVLWLCSVAVVLILRMDWTLWLENVVDCDCGSGRGLIFVKPDCMSAAE